ncbi:Unknown protein, partial [Striga hermonthica]
SKRERNFFDDNNQNPQPRREAQQGSPVEWGPVSEALCTARVRPDSARAPHNELPNNQTHNVVYKEIFNNINFFRDEHFMMNNVR